MTDLELAYKLNVANKKAMQAIDEIKALEAELKKRMEKLNEVSDPSIKPE
jgi:hypothetical protein